MTRSSSKTLGETALFPAGGPIPEAGAAPTADRSTPNRSTPGRPTPRRSSSSTEMRAAWIDRALEGAPTPEVPIVALRPGDPVPGTRYVIERWLGDGGMGVVYEARHIDIERRVAMKVLRAEFCRKPNVIRHFRDEARIVSRIGSEHIVEVHDFAELPDGRLLFVMDLLSGGTVASELEIGPLEPPRVVAILRQVCKALAAAHGAHIIHRDLKPDNIALHVQRGRRDFVKVLDFGIATVMSEADVATHFAAGTPSYLAPEVIVGERIDRRVDVYAVGCSAYEMLTGRPPFHGDGVEAVLRAQVEDTAVPPHLVRHNVPESLSAVVMKCLAKSPADRYPDMVELEAALCEAQISSGISTSWDDLELPELDPQRRIAILRGMPDSQGRSSAGGRRLWFALGAFALAVVSASAWVLVPRDTTHERSGPVQQLASAAVDAAAHSWFVYPPPDAPNTRTALQVILELEMRKQELGASASQEATRLRGEFADTLVRLGDQYWEREGGKPFAIDYYAEALMFVPDHPHAVERAILTPGQLATMRVKAETSTFSQAELIAAEPLIALADPDPERRSEKVEALQKREQPRSATTSDSLAQLARTEPAPKKREPAIAERTNPAPTEIVASPAMPAEILSGPATPVAEPRNVGRDPIAAAALVADAQRALDSGRRREAQKLFERALAADPRADAALIGLSDIRFHKGEYASAASLARKAIRLAPRRADYRIKLGDAYFKSFRYEDARTEYREAQMLGHSAASGRLAKIAAKLEQG
jgi:serine/threonine protein kinase/tetratricopeptide (TPR) repeat protein